MVAAPEIPDRAAIEIAATRIAGRVRTTPVIALEDSAFGLPPACALTLKLECLQHVGSFKPRGAFNHVLAQSTLPRAGLLAASGGNHGLAVAYVARALGVRAEIFVPAIAAPIKVARLRDYGAEVRIGGRDYAEALVACEARQAETGALSVHAYDEPGVVAGQGTLARELEAQAPGLDTVLVAVGGGGLIGGIAAWYGDGLHVVGVEPTGCAALHAALAAGMPVDVPVSGIAADSLGARRVGDIAFAVAGCHVERCVLVEDDAIRAAQRVLWKNLRVFAEPGGATALAALLSGAYRPERGERVGVVVCGGNGDPAALA
jgi:threonine dehydratase